MKKTPPKLCHSCVTYPIKYATGLCWRCNMIATVADDEGMTSYDIKVLTSMLFPDKKTTNYEVLKKEALQDPVVQRAYNENNLRRRVAKLFEDEMKKQGVTSRELARRMKTSPTQVRRLLHKEVGGALTLDTLCRAAVALGVVFSIDFGAAE